MSFKIKKHRCIQTELNGPEKLILQLKDEEIPAGHLLLKIFFIVLLL